MLSKFPSSKYSTSSKCPALSSQHATIISLLSAQFSLVLAAQIASHRQLMNHWGFWRQRTFWDNNFSELAIRYVLHWRVSCGLMTALSLASTQCAVFQACPTTTTTFRILEWNDWLMVEFHCSFSVMSTLSLEVFEYRTSLPEASCLNGLELLWDTCPPGPCWNSDSDVDRFIRCIFTNSLYSGWLRYFPYGFICFAYCNWLMLCLLFNRNLFTGVIGLVLFNKGNHVTEVCECPESPL